MKQILTIYILALGLTVSGCATYSTDECGSGDWNKIGLRDGSDGRTQDRFDHHGKACSLDRSQASRALYLAGRHKGLLIYCTAVRGYREAALGQKYYGVCPAATAGQFAAGYQLGSRILQLETQADKVNDAIFAVSSKLKNNALPDTRRLELKREQSRQQGEEARLRSELQLLRDKADAMVRAARSGEKK